LHFEAQTVCRNPTETPPNFNFTGFVVMRTFGLACFLTHVTAFSHADQILDDTSTMSLLQHSVRKKHKTAELGEGAESSEEPPPGAVDRIRARREARRRDPDRQLSDAQKAKLKARRAAKRQAHAAGKAAGERHFQDGASCDTCLTVCEELFNDVYKKCMIDRQCRPWQEEDGPASDKCVKRCKRAGTWQRTPCNRNCLCDADKDSLLEAKAETSAAVQSGWVGERHRCRDAAIGQVSDCTMIEQDRDSRAHDSVKKCAKAAKEKGADTFNFFRTAMEYGKCDLKNCGSADLKLITPPPEPESPAGHGNWKVFSTFCAEGPSDERKFDGKDIGAAA